MEFEEFEGSVRECFSFFILKEEGRVLGLSVFDVVGSGGGDALV